ncbi:MAG: hypothetical protein H0W64_10245 [Gammaproteobacteria bacterium]|nr:hypothetical protein [Gammaproteobacteria bacterium]
MATLLSEAFKGLVLEGKNENFENTLLAMLHNKHRDALFASYANQHDLAPSETELLKNVMNEIDLASITMLLTKATPNQALHYFLNIQITHPIYDLVLCEKYEDALWKWQPTCLDLIQKNNLLQLKNILLNHLGLIVNEARVIKINHACLAYRDHLLKEIYKVLPNEIPIKKILLKKPLDATVWQKLYALCQASDTLAVTHKNPMLGDFKDHLEQLQTLRMKDSILDITLKKFEVMCQLTQQVSLVDNAKLDPLLKAKHYKEKLTQFSHIYFKKKVFLEQNRDTATQSFLKSIATVLSLSLAAIFGIWRTEGQKFTKEVNMHLPANRFRQSKT